ncbi:hypothetical protein HU200_060994 [Digitaria exilis]|uniref:G domain-containing protein n=1 Tax=Digitaria exilis TaxID=1010633 RepID=A0A835A5J8_9POAL|nr:hypothetical protein HU200_060994 [Digitaria exilis]
MNWPGDAAILVFDIPTETFQFVPTPPPSCGVCCAAVVEKMHEFVEGAAATLMKRWDDYFKARDILYIFWSAKATNATVEGKKLSGCSDEESASLDSDTLKIYDRDELLMRLQAEAESIVTQRRTTTTEEDHDVNSSDSVSSVAKHLVVVFVGYPNVGKSSTINALVAEMRGFTQTNGKIKFTICDVPGIILPCFTSPRNDWSPEEGINFDHLATSNLCKKVADGLTIVQVGYHDIILFFSTYLSLI